MIYSPKNISKAF